MHGSSRFCCSLDTFSILLYIYINYPGPIMKISNLEIAQKLKVRLTQKIPFVEIRLFGSRARDDYEETSDMDIFIELEDVTREVKNIIADTAWELGLENLIHISPIIFSKDEIEHSPQRSSSLVRNILNEGIKI